MLVEIFPWSDDAAGGRFYFVAECGREVQLGGGLWRRPVVYTYLCLGSDLFEVRTLETSVRYSYSAL